MRTTTLTAVAARFFRDESGPTATEYAVMLALIIVVVMGSVATLGINLNTKYGTMNSAMFP